MNRIIEKYQAGSPSFGTFTHLKSTVAIEALAYTGLDYVVLDTEHAPVNIEFVAAAITAADAAGVTPLVRINEISRSAVLQPLDVGAKGLIVPAVETPEQVQQLIQYAKFAPLGNRGCCATRDGGWGFAEHASQGYGPYMADANRQTMLIPQCETVGCLEHIEEIAAMEGVDGIFVGPLDLSIALGVPGQTDAPVMQEALAKVVAVCKQNHKPVFMFCKDAPSAKAQLTFGFDSIALGLDTSLYIRAYRSMLDEINV